MSPELLTAYTAIAVAVGSFIFSVWKNPPAAREELAEMAEKLDVSVNARIDSHKRMVGDALTAMRTKVEDTERNVTKIELWNRDNFVRRAEFSDAVLAIRGEFNGLANRFDRKLDAIDNKLDRMTPCVFPRSESP